MIDLHVHTTKSDGKMTPVEILKEAETLKLKAISITDHNTCMAYEELKNVEIDKIYTGALIKGCEFNVMVDNVPIELLGYHIDTEYMQSKLKDYYLSFKDMNLYETNMLIKKCLELGLTLNVEDITYDIEHEYGNRGVHREIVKHPENKLFLDQKSWENPHYFSINFINNPSSEFYVDTSNLIPDYREIVQLIRDAGGLVFMPHVFKYKEKSMEVLNTLLEQQCLDGIECYHSTYNNEQSEYLLQLCDQLGLLKSGGSDTHGTPGNKLAVGYGNMCIPDEILTWGNLKNRKGESENGKETPRQFI